MKNVYVYMKPKMRAGEVATSETVGKNIVIDRDEQRNIIGVEVLHAERVDVSEDESNHE